MAYPHVDKFRRRYFNATMADISTASSVYIPMPCRGRVVRAYVSIDAAITGADSALTASINSTAITGMTGTATNSGSAAGNVFTLSDATAARDFVDGDVVKLTTDGASSTTAVAQWTLVVDTY
jgi:hypothetical protein